jgi:hypothetical protein
MAYTPPDGNLANITFRNAYTVPDGNLANLTLGTVDEDARNVAPFPISPGGFGTASVVNLAQGVFATGIAPGAFGTATVFNWLTYALPTGIAPLGVGEPWVSDLHRYLEPGGIAAGEVGSATTVTHYERTLALNGFVATAFGTTSLQLAFRAVAPSSFFETRFGTASVSDGERFLTPAGISEGAFGTLTIQRNERFVQAQGIVGEVGTPDVQLSRRFVGVRDTAPHTEWGFAQVYNSRQYVTQVTDEAEQQLDHGFGEGLVENRNKVIGAVGNNMARVSNFALVANNARVLEAPGLDAGQFGDQLVAYRIRTVFAQGVDTSHFVSWHALHNRTSILEPSGIPRLHVGVPRVIDTTQRLRDAGREELTLWGDAFVAPAIRIISVAGRGIAAGFFPDPYVGLYRQYLAPEGMQGGVGTPTLEHHRNIVAPHGVDYLAFGELSTRNVTPELRAGSIEPPNGGVPYVGLYTRTLNVDAEGIAPPTWTKLYFIGDRTRRLAPNGVDTLRVPMLHRVHIDEPQIPEQQYVLVEPFPPGGLVDQAGYGTAALTYYGVLAQGFLATTFGTPTLRANSIYPLGIYDIINGTAFGTPTLAPTQFVRPRWDDEDTPAFPEPLVSPTYIYISEPPKGGRKENSIVDEFIQSTYPSWGTATVSLGLRSIQQHHSDSDAAGETMGQPAVTYKHRRITLDGILPRRVGIPMLSSPQDVRPYWGRDTEEEIEGGNYDTAGYGVAVITRPPVYDPNLRPTGIAAPDFGTARVELFNRTIAPASWYSNIFTGNNWVHPPIVLYPVGTDTALFGTAWASDRVRTVRPQGYISTSFEHGVSRTSVRTVDRFTPAGFMGEVVPAPSIANAHVGAYATLGDTLRMGRPRVGDCPTC